MSCADMVVRKYYSKWLTFCKSLNNSKEDGQDMLQDLLTELHIKGRIESLACSGEDDRAIDLYMHRMIKTRHISNHRRQKIEIVRGFLPDWIADQAPNEETAYGRQYEQVDVYIDWLHEYETELMKLSKMPGFSVRVYSEITGLSVKTVRNDIRNAKKKIKAYVLNTTKNQE